MTLLLFPQDVTVLSLELIAPLKPLYSSFSIYYPTLPGEKGVAFAAQFNLESLLSGADSKGIPTGANYLSITIILGMNFILHIIQLA